VGGSKKAMFQVWVCTAAEVVAGAAEVVAGAEDVVAGFAVVAGAAEQPPMIRATMIRIAISKKADIPSNFLTFIFPS